MAIPATAGYNVDELDWLRDELGIAHVELDPWGSIIVTPASDEHEIVLAMLHEQAVRQLDLPPGSVWSNGFAWKVPEGSGYTNVPDLVVLAPGWTRVAGNHVSPPPLLVVEVASPSTRAVDRGRKLSDYRTGGAGCYLLADAPGLTRGGEVRFELHDFEAGAVTTADGSVDVALEGRTVRFDLTSFRRRIRGE